MIIQTNLKNISLTYDNRKNHASLRIVGIFCTDLIVTLPRHPLFVSKRGHLGIHDLL